MSVYNEKKFLQNNRRNKHRFYGEIVANITTCNLVCEAEMDNRSPTLYLSICIQNVVYDALRELLAYINPKIVT